MPRVAPVAAAVAALAAVAAAFGPNCKPIETAVLRGEPVYDGPLVPNLKVAFLGDTGNGEENLEVFQMVKTWGAEAVFHAGDSSYDNDPDAFWGDVDEVFGTTFPYFFVIGNHDNLKWERHAELITERLDRMNATAYCSGEVGVEQVCNYKGLFIAMTGVGCRRTPEEGTAFLDSIFPAYPNIWRISMWHKNQLKYQTGSKLNGVGWGVYEASLKHGAIVMTGHEHSYSRTYTMSSFIDTEIYSTDNDVQIAANRSFVVVSGIGGRGIRGWERGLNENPWWASCAASDNGVSDGALLCTFNYNGDPRLAHCVFRDRLDRQWDEFYIRSDNTNTTDAAAVAAARRAPVTTNLREVAVSRAEGDVSVHLPTGRVDAHAARLRIGGEFIARLAFDDVPLTDAASGVLKAAHLQVLGAEIAEQPWMLIRAVVEGDRLTQAAVLWDREDEGFETSTLWASPNLVPLMAEVAAEFPHAVPTSITFVITGSEGTEIYTYDYDACRASTLALEY